MSLLIETIPMILRMFVTSYILIFIVRDVFLIHFSNGHDPHSLTFLLILGQHYLVLLLMILPFLYSLFTQEESPPNLQMKT